MVYFVFFLEIAILFLLSGEMSRTLSRFLPVGLISFIFLPGVIIHELSHLLTAAILFVSVGEMEFVPKKHGNSVRLGSVEIGKTDPIRRAIIGFAPVLTGLVIIIAAVYLFSSNLALLQRQSYYVFIFALLILAYLLFAVGNTMFASPRDMEGATEILIALLIIFAGAYLLGFRLPLGYLDKIFAKEMINLMQKSTLFLLAPIAVDLILLGTIKLTTYSRTRSR